MANSIKYNDKILAVGDTVSVSYKIREGDKERVQAFVGLLIKVKGNRPETKMITVRKISHSGIGVERIIPLSSPFLTSFKLVKKSSYTKAKAYFVRGFSDQHLRKKLYSHEGKKS